jgi:hypothetical protein
MGPLSSSDSRLGVSPTVESTRLGSRSASTMPTPKTRNAARSGHSGPMSARVAAMPAPTVPEMMPDREIRELAATRLASSGPITGAITTNGVIVISR